MLKCLFYGIGFIVVFILCAFLLLLVDNQEKLHNDPYIASVAPILDNLESQAMSASTLIIYPTFDDAWASDVDDVYASMRTIQVRLKRVKPSLEWNATHNDLLNASSNCVSSIEMLKIGLQAESLMDLCLTGIKRVKAKISD